MIKSTLPANLEGALDLVRDAFLTLEKQERRILNEMRKRENELSEMATEAKEIDDAETAQTRGLKTVEVYDNLQHNALKLINDNNKTRVDLVKFYVSSIITPKNQSPEGSAKTTGLDQNDMDYLRDLHNKTKK